MSVFHTNRTTVGVLQLRENLRQRQHLATEEIRRIKNLGRGQGIEAQSLVRQLEIWGGVSQRVGPSLQMRQCTVGMNCGENLSLADSIHGGTRHRRSTFGRLGWKREPKLKAFEESAPIRLDRLGVLFPTLVVLSNQVGVPA